MYGGGNIGRGFIRAVMAERAENGPFTAFDEFCTRMCGRELNRRAVESFIRAGAFDQLEPNRHKMVNALESMLKSVENENRRKAYAADITYGTNNEIGFDYLRDNMVIYRNDLTQRGHAFAIVDEVDSILIDEARTPLIISGKGEDSSKLYEMTDYFVSTLRRQVFAKTEDKEAHDDYDCDYFVDEKSRTVSLTASGIAKAEKYFGLDNLADMENTTISHHINQAMKARGLMKKDIDYVVKDGQIIIVDEFTGRLMYGRRYNEGLHQAIEAKEKVTVASESKTLATITFQNFFRLYNKLSGMTGTALTEKEEFEAIFLANGSHLFRQALDVFIGNQSHFDDIYPFCFRSRTGSNHHLFAYLQYLLVA